MCSSVAGTGCMDTGPGLSHFRTDPEVLKGSLAKFASGCERNEEIL